MQKVSFAFPSKLTLVFGIRNELQIWISRYSATAFFIETMQKFDEEACVFI
jgi:hypothetical protein